MRSFRIVILVLGLAACQAAERLPTDSTLSETRYENHFFGVSLPLPEDWSVASAETTERVREVGRKAIAGDDAVLQATVDNALETTYQLLMVSQHPMGSPVPFNPTLVLIAENVAHAPGIETGADYLFHVGSALERGALPYEALGDAEPFPIAGQPFHRRNFRLALSGGLLQTYIFKRSGDYALGFILTAPDPPTLETLVGFASRVEFRAQHGEP